MLFCSVTDPDLVFHPWIRGWVKYQDPESWINIPDHISVSLEKIFG